MRLEQLRGGAPAALGTAALATVALALSAGATMAAEGDQDSSFSGDGRLVFAPGNGASRGCHR